jgi:hypothetical protein
MLDLPHPLLADDVDFRGADRRPREVEEHLGAPAEHHHGDAERDDCPEQLEGQRAVNRHADLVVVLPAELDRENDDERRDEHREERGDRDHEEEDGIDLARLGRCCFREERKVREHR